MICPRLSLLSCVEIGDNGADALRCVADAGKVIAEQRADLVEEVRQADAIDALVAVGGQPEGEMERAVEAQVLERVDGEEEERVGANLERVAPRRRAQLAREHVRSLVAVRERECGEP